MNIFVRLVALLALVLGWMTTAAQAKGIAVVQQSDGVVRTYRVMLQVIDHRALRITSADGRGTLVVGKAACSYAGDLERCLPYAIELVQFGRKHPIALEHGTEYLNRSAVIVQLPMSTNHVPPHGVLLLMRTVRGTYITVHGTIDGFSR